MYGLIKTKRIGESLITAGLLLYATFLLKPVDAQVVGGTLSGTVLDSSSSLIVNARISVENPATGNMRSVVTDEAGFYLVPNLLPGIYNVTVEASGFAPQVRKEITLNVGGQQILNFSLQLGTVKEAVRVVSEAPPVDLASSSIGAVVDSSTIRELPLNGRSWTDLATLQPGVAAIETQRAFNSGPGAAGRAIRGFGAQVTISGARPQQNNYRLDGININDHANAGPGSVLGGNLGVDAIQEFSVLTSNYSAEYGRTSGGVVNATTRSGTNKFHGSAYEFLRNSALDARNFFDGNKVPPFRRNQFGAAGGGPIRRDQTFIFADYEGVRQSKGIAQVDIVPSAAARSGNLSSGQVTVDPSAQKYLGFYPLPNGPLLSGGDTGIFTFAAQQVINENFLTARIDHRFSTSDSLFGTYVYDSTPYISPDNLDNTLIRNKTRRQFVAIEETHTISPHFVNAIRLGYNRSLTDGSVNQAAINPLATDTTLGAVPGRTATGVAVPGLLTQFSGGLGGQGTFQFRLNSFQLYDDGFVTKRAHSIKFGFTLERIQLNSLQTDIPNGTFTFSSLKNFLVNQPKRLDLPLPGKVTPRDLRQTVFGIYVQDDWQWRPNLMLNLGIRYEMSTVPTEIQGKLSTLLNITDPQPHLGNPYFLNPTLRNFEPRLGFAWDPFRDGKTAIRGGFGIFDVLPLPYESIQTVYLPAPFYALGSSSNLPAGSFYAGAAALLGPKSLNATYIEHKPHRNYVMQWNLNLQRQITSTFTGMIAYVGSRGVHQPFRSDDMDIVLPTKTSDGYIWPLPAGSVVVNPNFGSIRSLVWGGDSYFHAFETQLTQRISHGLQLQGSFTWGKSIDTSSSTESADQFTNSISSLPWFNKRLGRGLSDFSIGRTLVINGTWRIPDLKSASGPVVWVANGWELGAIYKASDGTPFSATFGTDGDPLGLKSSDPWDFPNRLTGPGCGSLTNPGNPNHYIKTECFAIPTASSLVLPLCDPTVGVPPQCFNLRGNAGRNILIGPGISNVDFSIFKNFPGERFKVQFRAEFFNILNHANFAVPITPDHTDIFDSSGNPSSSAGLLTSTTTTAREIQLALKLTW